MMHWTFNSSNILSVSDKSSELRSWPRVIYLVGKSGWMQISIVMKLSLRRHSQPSCRSLFSTYMKSTRPTPCTRGCSIEICRWCLENDPTQRQVRHSKTIISMEKVTCCEKWAGKKIVRREKYLWTVPDRSPDYWRAPPPILGWNKSVECD